MDFGRQMRAPSFLDLRDHKEAKDVTTRPEALNSPLVHSLCSLF